MARAIIFLLAGLGILLVGFKMLSENIEKLANKGLKKMFNKTSKNYFVGVGIGAVVTAVIQSSAASTVMIVGFVNAGIMNLFQATAMIMGANIGTTITAQIVALGAADVTMYAMVLAAVGMFIYMLLKKDKYKSLGLAISGLGLVFIALWLMQDAMGTFAQNDAITSFLAKCSNPFLLLLFGIGFTALIQSSSAVTTILISMVVANISIGGSANGILFVILGSNIGTTVTALLSSLGASPNAKRASFIHLLFNLSGALLFFVILLLWPSFMDVTFVRWFKGNAPMQIAMFHTFFNVICTLLFLPLIKGFVKLSELFIKDKKVEYKPSFIDERFLKTPAIALSQANKEVMRFGKLSMETLNLSITAFLKGDIDNFDEIENKTQEIEILNQTLLSYLVKVSYQEISDDDEAMISKLHQIINDFYREVEIADNMMKYTKSTVNNDLKFSDKIYDQIKVLESKLSLQYDNVYAMAINGQLGKLAEVEIVEEEIDKMRSDMINQHIERLEKNECSPASSGVFINLVSNLERAGDHLNYIAHLIADK